MPGKAVQAQEQPLVAVIPQQLIVDHQQVSVGLAAQQDVVLGETVLVLIPVQHTADLAAIGGDVQALGLLAPIVAEPGGIRVIADVARQDDHQVFAVMGVWVRGGPWRRCHPPGRG